MHQIIDVEVHPDDAEPAPLTLVAARALKVRPERVTGIETLRRAIDARHRRVRIKLRVAVTLDAPAAEPKPLVTHPLPTLRGEPEAVIVGAGPAGLFAAWALARRGVRSVLLDRGASVRGRRPHLARLNREGVLHPDSNYCFGEGGAGTYSDGKLYTRATKRGPVRTILEVLVECGAPRQILVDARPHIGTNRLPKVVAGLRERLVEAGVIVRYETRVDDLVIEGERVAGVRLSDGEAICAPAVVLVTGHSARDTYRMLGRHQVALEAKPYAVGVRIEHPQPIIDRIQYGALAGHPQLGAAPYALKRTIDGVGVYSFCMCPGGFIVAAATEADGVVVNGMSPSKRNSRFANSGMVVTVGPEAFGDDPMRALDYQAAIERRAFTVGGGRFRAPAQRVTDYIEGRVSADLPPCSYRPGLTPADLHEVLPEPLDEALRSALRWFDRKRMPGYVTAEAVMVGVESRSSAPIRIPRDRQTLQSTTHPGLYPGGEGAGYAGGIVSAALDGLRLADAVADQRGAPQSNARRQGVVSSPP